MIRAKKQFRRSLPFVFEKEPDTAAVDSAAPLSRREYLAEKLLVHGAVLLRGFGIADLSDFENFVRSFSGKELFGYAGGVSPRNSLKGAIYTSTEYPPEVGLSLHNELSYADVFPANLYFGCLIAPAVDGETTLGDSRRILQKLDAEVLGLFKRKQICYIRNLEADKFSDYSWQAAFETENRAEVEKVCRKIGASFEWQPDGRLQVRQIRPATVKHPVTGEEVWFNQADGFHPSNLGLENYETFEESEFRLNCTFGDGTPIEPQILEHVRRVLRSETIPHRWLAGDILILDNLLTAHGRKPFSGPRKIVLAMT